MKVVGKIPYKSVTPQLIEQLDHELLKFGSNVQVILDSATETVLLVV